MKAQSDNTVTSSLEIAKLGKENQDLREVIGWFALEKKADLMGQKRSLEEKIGRLGRELFAWVEPMQKWIE